jgi:hypothetical protein
MGCSSSSGDGGSSSGSSGGGSSSGSNTPVSFKTDIMPIFQQSCTLTTECHGQVGNAGEENLYLGVDSTATNTSAIISQVYTGLVGAPALEDPKLSLVKVNDHANSYLYIKLSYSQQMLNALTDCNGGQCNGSTCVGDMICGTTMPYGNEMLTTQLQTFADWIDQGAQNN